MPAAWAHQNRVMAQIQGVTDLLRHLYRLAGKIEKSDQDHATKNETVRHIN